MLRLKRDQRGLCNFAISTTLVLMVTAKSNLKGSLLSSHMKIGHICHKKKCHNTMRASYYINKTVRNKDRDVDPKGTLYFLLWISWRFVSNVSNLILFPNLQIGLANANYFKHSCLNSIGSLPNNIAQHSCAQLENVVWYSCALWKFTFKIDKIYTWIGDQDKAFSNFRDVSWHRFHKI